MCFETQLRCSLPTNTSTFTSVSSSASRLHRCAAVCSDTVEPNKGACEPRPPSALQTLISWLINRRKREGTLVTFGSFAFLSLMLSKLFLLIFFFLFLFSTCSLPSPHLTPAACCLPPPCAASGKRSESSRGRSRTGSDVL